MIGAIIFVPASWGIGGLIAVGIVVVLLRGLAAAVPEEGRRVAGFVVSGIILVGAVVLAAMAFSQ